ncbi:MAG: ATP-binding protein [Bacteroidota bacterium]|nr:ATP-binding protein [Bacteroidota bacterium]
MLHRFIEKKLLNTVNNFPATGIIGPRQVGKTTLAKQLIRKIEKETVYVDIENPRDRVKLSDPVLFFENHIDKCIIIDEIQLMPELFSVLRPMIDMKREPGRFIILGSASPLLLRQSSQSLAGRIAYIELSGFNLLELETGSQNKLWLKGGFPDAFLSKNTDIWQQWLDNFIRTYINTDLPILGLDINRNTIRNLWTMLSHVNAQVINYSNIARSLAVSSTTLKKYIDFLENAFLIRQLQPFYPNIKKRIVKAPKVYLRDTGILHNLLNINSSGELEGNPLKGNSWEGYVIEQILQIAGASYESYFYRTHQGAECDLVLTKSSKPVYAIEIKFSAAPTLTKGNKIAFEDIGAKKNFIIVPESEEYLLSKNITVCGLNSFLEKLK